MPDYTKHNPLAHLYKTAAWQRVAAAIKARDHYTCQNPQCGKLCTAKGDAIADHIRAHDGDLALFWDEDNLQCLCKSCHDGWKQRSEKTTRMQRADGW